MRRAFILVLSLAILLAVCAQALALEVHRFVTPQGLTVLHVQRDNVPMVVFTLMIKSGAVNEPPGRAGLSSLTASLLEEGTTTRSSMQISQELEFIGARYSANGGTEGSTMSLTVLKKDVKKGLDIFTDMLLRPSFPEEEVARVKDLVKGSLEQSEEDPSFVVGREFGKALFGDHPYGRVIDGTPETVDSIGRDDIVDFHSRYYVPNNAILAVVGGITEQELEALLNKYFGSWAEKPVPPLHLAPPVKPEHKVVKVDRDLTQANILLGNIGLSRNNPDYYAAVVMNYILGGGGFSSRMMASVREKMGLAYDVHSYFSPHKLPGSFEAGVQTKNATANKAIDEMLLEIKRMREERVSSKELQDAKSFLIGSYPRKFDTMGKVAGFLTQVEFFGLGLDYIDKYPELINAVTQDDVLRVARKYLDPDNYVLVVVGKQAEAKIIDPSTVVNNAPEVETPAEAPAEPQAEPQEAAPGVESVPPSE